MKTWRWIIVMLVVLFVGVPSRSVGAASSARYFAPTGHWVQGHFLTFFDEHGGLDVFGYPRTELLITSGRPVQYFQRARLESWPENQPPYDVQLMLIGDAVMGPGDPPIPSSQVPPPGDTSRTYFAQTGHTLSGAFRDYYNGHGGLTIFGYPTSEPYTGSSGFIIQRFQRARFEYHPELPAAFQVSEGLLGDEYIFALGMVPLSATLPASSATSPPALTASGGGQLLFQTQPGGNLVVASLDGSGSHVVGQGFDPSWSPDGTKIAYAVRGANPGIYVANADGSHPVVVYAGPDTRSPVWSPDGTQIAFYRRFNGWKLVNGVIAADDFFQVVVARMSDHSTWLPRDQPVHSYSPSWSPDGRQIVFLGDNGLFLATPDQPARVIPNTYYHDTSPAWSPDGSQIAITIWNHDHWDVGLIRPDGSGLRVLTAAQVSSDQPANNAAAAWSPDGNRLVFVSDRSGSWNLYIMNVDGSNVVPTGVSTVTYTGSFDRVVNWKK